MMASMGKTVLIGTEPKFRDSTQLSPEQLSDPDYRLKQIAKLNRGKFTIHCSRCHHCR